MITWTIDFPDRTYSSRTGRDEEGNVFYEDASRERVECHRPSGSVGRGWTPEQALQDALKADSDYANFKIDQAHDIPDAEPVGIAYRSAEDL